MFMKADEVAEVLEVSKPYAYKLLLEMRAIQDELRRIADGRRQVKIS